MQSITLTLTGHYDSTKHATVRTRVYRPLVNGEQLHFISNRQFRDASRRAGLATGDYLVDRAHHWTATDDGWIVNVNVNE